MTLGAEDVEPARRVHLLALLGARGPVLGEALVDAPLLPLRRLLELLADLLSGGDVLRPLLLVAALGAAERLLVRTLLLLVLALGLDVGVLGAAVRLAELRGLAVRTGATLHEEPDLHH